MTITRRNVLLGATASAALLPIAARLLAERDGADDELVVAALCHDLGPVAGAAGPEDHQRRDQEPNSPSPLPDIQGSPPTNYCARPQMLRHEV